MDLSDLVLSLHVVPELRLGKHWVFGEDSHSVEFWVRALLRGQSSSDDKELSDLYRVYYLSMVVLIPALIQLRLL